jgi:hypothetical protein
MCAIKIHLNCICIFLLKIKILIQAQCIFFVKKKNINMVIKPQAVRNKNRLWYESCITGGFLITNRLWNESSTTSGPKQKPLVIVIQHRRSESLDIPDGFLSEPPVM